MYNVLLKNKFTKDDVLQPSVTTLNRKIEFFFQFEDD